jgi:hypothetical protein
MWQSPIALIHLAVPELQYSINTLPAIVLYRCSRWKSWMHLHWSHGDKICCVRNFPSDVLKVVVSQLQYSTILLLLYCMRG